MRRFPVLTRVVSGGVRGLDQSPLMAFFGFFVCMALFGAPILGGLLGGRTSLLLDLLVRTDTVLVSVGVLGAFWPLGFATGMLEPPDIAQVSRGAI